MRTELVERAKGGDHEAFAALVRSSIEGLYATAMLILRDRDSAEDAVQDALLKAWRGLRALRDPEAWDAWSRQLVVRSCYEHRRKATRFKVVELDLATTDTHVATDSALSLSDRDELERGFAKLPVDQRAILVLRYYQGLQLGEIADVLGVPLGTAKSRLHRATETMRAALEADSRVAVAVGGQLS